MGCAQGAKGKLHLDSALPFDANSEAFEFKSETIKLKETVVGSDAIRGTLSRYDGTKRVVQKTVSGSFVTHVSPVYINRILGRMMSGSPLAPAESLTSFLMNVYRVANSTNFVYTGCVVNEVTIRGREGQLLEMEVGVIGASESTNTTGFTSEVYVDSLAYAPMAFSDITTCSIAATSVVIKAMELKISYGVKPKFNNSLTATDLCPQDRLITIKLETSYADEYAKYAASSGASAAQAVIIAITTASTGITFTMPKVRGIQESPSIPGRDDIPWTFMGEAGASVAGGDEIAVLVDATV